MCASNTASADSTPPPLAVTMGDPAGIGLDLILALWATRRADLPPFTLLADAGAVADRAALLGLEAAAADLPITPLPTILPPGTGQAGTPDAATAPASTAAIDRAVAMCVQGTAGGMVTLPINKAVMAQGGFDFPGHTEYLGHLAGIADAPVMMLACPDLRVVPVTVHMAIRDVPAALTTDAIVHAGRVTAAALARDFGCATPRLAVAGLNPHAGEQGRMGTEEARIITPAIDILRAEGIAVSGPAPADTLFHAAARETYDAALCMYHDQALIPLKTLDFSRGVNITLGLPFVRTSPDHGTAYGLAGTGRADAASLFEALRTAHEMAQARHRAAS